jgi:hypothetical protein
MNEHQTPPANEDGCPTGLAVSTGSLPESALADLAAKIANDINEGIDCRETRATLRDVVRWWSMQHCVTASELSLRKTDIVVGKLAVQLLLRLTKRSRSKNAEMARQVADHFLKANV